MRIWDQLQTAYRLEPGSRSRFLLAHLLLLSITLAMHLRGLRWTSHQLKKLRSPHMLGAGWTRSEQLKVTLAMVRLAVRYSPWSNCLRQSLTLWTLLQWQGIAADLRIGMRRVGEKMESHAWLEVEGQVVGDHADIVQQYTAFNRTIKL